MVHYYTLHTHTSHLTQHSSFYSEHTCNNTRPSVTVSNHQIAAAHITSEVVAAAGGGNAVVDEGVVEGHVLLRQNLHRLL